MEVIVARVGEIEPGEIRQVEIEGEFFAVYHLEDGTHCATADLCSHGQALLSEGWLEGDEVECPLHNGCFNVRTGEPTALPCEEPIRTFPIRIEGEDVVLTYTE